MGMTKAEKAEMDRLRHDLALARALRWPDYVRPVPMAADEIRSRLVDGGMKYGQPTKVARGWFYGTHDAARGLGASLSYGCSDGMYHSRDGDVTTSHGRGAMYPSKLEALMAARHELTESFAEILAKVDAQIAETGATE